MFYNELNNFNRLKPRKGHTKEKETKMTLSDNVSERYNEYLEIYFDQYMAQCMGVDMVLLTYSLKHIIMSASKT